MSNSVDKETSKLLAYMTTFDGGVYMPSRKDRSGLKANAQFIMNMRKENLDYVQWVQGVIQRVTGAVIKDRPDYNDDGCVRQPQVRLESKRHPFLTKLRHRIYTDTGHKVIDLHMLTQMDAEALAIIFMADGGTQMGHGKYPEIHLHTKGFSEADNMALSKAIYEKLGIRTTVNRHHNYFLLRVKTADVQKFADTVYPHVLPSFRYKLERLAPVIKPGGVIVCSPAESGEAHGNDVP